MSLLIYAAVLSRFFVSYFNLFIQMMMRFDTFPKCTYILYFI